MVCVGPRTQDHVDLSRVHYPYATAALAITQIIRTQIINLKTKLIIHLLHNSSSREGAPQFTSKAMFESLARYQDSDVPRHLPLGGGVLTK